MNEAQRQARDLSGSTTQGEREVSGEIGRTALMLHQKAMAADLPFTAYLLDMVVMETSPLIEEPPAATQQDGDDFSPLRSDEPPNVETLVAAVQYLAREAGDFDMTREWEILNRAAEDLAKTQ